MKKLLSFLAVAAIVTSAFAFSTKIVTFCVRNGAQTACQLVNDKMIASGTPNNKHYPFGVGQWDGTAAGCTNAAVTACSVDVKLISN